MLGACVLHARTGKWHLSMKKVTKFQLGKKNEWKTKIYSMETLHVTIFCELEKSVLMFHPRVKCGNLQSTCKTQYKPWNLKSKFSAVFSNIFLVLVQLVPNEFQLITWVWLKFNWYTSKKKWIMKEHKKVRRVQEYYWHFTFFNINPYVVFRIRLEQSDK